MPAGQGTRPGRPYACLDEAWPRGRTAIKRAEIGRQRGDALAGIVALRDRIVTARAETLADAAVQLTPRPAM